MSVIVCVYEAVLDSVPMSVFVRVPENVPDFVPMSVLVGVSVIGWVREGDKVTSEEPVCDRVRSSLLVAESNCVVEPVASAL